VLTGAYVDVGRGPTTTNSLGAVSLPTVTVCGLGLPYQYAACHICNEDCYVAHNLWGGDCGPSPITGQTTCLCAESSLEAIARKIEPSSTHCAAYNPISESETFLGLSNPEL